VPGDSEALEAERSHRFDLVEGQRTLRILRVVRPGGRLGAIATAAQVGRDDGELGGQTRSELAHIRWDCG
jgi:hypothetical protein